MKVLIILASLTTSITSFAFSQTVSQFCSSQVQIKVEKLMFKAGYSIDLSCEISGDNVDGELQPGESTYLCSRKIFSNGMVCDKNMSVILSKDENKVSVYRQTNSANCIQVEED